MDEEREGLRARIALVECDSTGELGPNHWPGRLPPLADEPLDRLTARDGDTHRDCRIRSVSITADDQARSVSRPAPASSPSSSSAPCTCVGTRILRADDRVRLARTSPKSSGCGRPSTRSGPGAKRRRHQLRLPEWHWARPPPRPVYSQDGPPDSNTSAPGNSSANRPPGRCFTSEDITTEHRRQA